MATTKKKTEPKGYTLTLEQIEQLRDLAVDMMNIRRSLEDLEGYNDIGTIMFKIGSIYNVANKAETEFDELIDEIDGKCDECGEDY